MLSLFRKVALIEGITTLLLFLVAMPLKYLFDQPFLIRPFGMVHGVAFIAYIVVMIAAFAIHRIGPMGWLRSFAASLVPFGTFINDPWVARQERAA